MEIAARGTDVSVAEELLRQNDVAGDSVEGNRCSVAKIVQAPFRREPGALEATLEPSMRTRMIHRARSVVPRIEKVLLRRPVA
jgi:hypothetical protein